MSTGGKAAAAVRGVALVLAICMAQGCTPSKLAPEELAKAQQQPHIYYRERLIDDIRSYAAYCTGSARK